jgi:hypothetical protein
MDHDFPCSSVSKTIAANVQRVYAVVFAARKRCGGSRYQQINFLRLEPQTNLRQKQWSELYDSFQKK